MRAAGDRHANDAIFLAVIAKQQGLEGREKRHEQSDILARGERFEAIDQIAIDEHLLDGAAVGLYRRAGPVAGKGAHRREMIELTSPVSRLAIKPSFVDAALLPRCKVGVLKRQFGKRRELDSRGTPHKVA